MTLGTVDVWLENKGQVRALYDCREGSVELLAAYGADGRELELTLAEHLALERAAERLERRASELHDAQQCRERRCGEP